MMFCLMISEIDDMAGPYIGQVDEVPLVNPDGSPVLGDDGKPKKVKLTVVASTAGNAPEPAPEAPQQ